MSKTDETLVIGGTPLADLLPPEIRKEHQGRKTRGKLLWGIAAVALLVVMGWGGSFALALTSQVALASAQNRTNDLLLEQQKYSEVRVIQSGVAAVQAGQRVGTATEIDWKAYLDRVAGALPLGASVTTVSIDSASPLIDFAQSTIPLQGQRVATVSLVVDTQTLADVSVLLTALAELPGVVDATPSSVTDSGTGDGASVSLTLHVDQEAWSERFVPEEEKTNTSDSDEAAVPTTEGE